MGGASSRVVSPVGVEVACGRVRNTVSSYERGRSVIPAILATGEEVIQRSALRVMKRLGSGAAGSSRERAPETNHYYVM